MRNAKYEEIKNKAKEMEENENEAVGGEGDSEDSETLSESKRKRLLLRVLGYVAWNKAVLKLKEPKNFHSWEAFTSSPFCELNETLIRNDDK